MHGAGAEGAEDTAGSVLTVHGCGRREASLHLPAPPSRARAAGACCPDYGPHGRQSSRSEQHLLSPASCHRLGTQARTPAFRPGLSVCVPARLRPRASAVRDPTGHCLPPRLVRRGGHAAGSPSTPPLDSPCSGLGGSPGATPAGVQVAVRLGGSVRLSWPPGLKPGVPIVFPVVQATADPPDAYSHLSLVPSSGEREGRYC